MALIQILFPLGSISSKNNLMTTVNTVSSCEKFLSLSSMPSIVCISSICGSIVIPDAPIGYSCSKAALNMYIRCKAIQLSQMNIRINAVEPGNIMFEGSVWERRYNETL